MMETPLERSSKQRYADVHAESQVYRFIQDKNSA